MKLFKNFVFVEDGNQKDDNKTRVEKATGFCREMRLFFLIIFGCYSILLLVNSSSEFE